MKQNLSIKEKFHQWRQNNANAFETILCLTSLSMKYKFKHNTVVDWRRFQVHMEDFRKELRCLLDVNKYTYTMCTAPVIPLLKLNFKQYFDKIHSKYNKEILKAQPTQQIIDLWLFGNQSNTSAFELSTPDFPHPLAPTSRSDNWYRHVWVNLKYKCTKAWRNEDLVHWRVSALTAPTETTRPCDLMMVVDWQKRHPRESRKSARV